MALVEHSVVDARNERVTNANFSEYAVPVHADAPPVMDVIFVDEDDPHVRANAYEPPPGGLAFRLSAIRRVRRPSSLPDRRLVSAS
jgi:hypothetical protein